MSEESFADVPKSFLEVRSEQLADGGLWSPRDALICVLRQLDSGEIAPGELIVVWSERAGSDKTFNVSSVIACPNTLTSVGLLTVAIDDMLARNNT